MIPTTEHVVLVDTDDNDLGTMEKMKAHETGSLHRAFSAFVFNSKGQLLLQRRAYTKYHSRGQWTNTCCSHPRLGELIEEAASRRLREEMGITCAFKAQFSFIYHAPMEDGLSEHELDHVLYGHTDDVPQPNPQEVAEWRYATLDEIREELESHPEVFTAWFKLCFERVLNDHKTIYSNSSTL